MDSKNKLELAAVANCNRRMLIGGELVEALSAAVMAVESPGDASALGQVPAAGAADVDRAVRAARTALPTWRTTDLMVRRRMILDFAAVLRTHAELIATIDAVDSGSPIKSMRQDVLSASLYLEWVAGLAFAWGGETAPVAGSGINLTLREPHGVVARIVPFNHPAIFACKIAAPLLTGNTVVLKVPDQTPLSGLWMAEHLADIFPPGVVNIISGEGREAGAALVQHPGIDAIAFTGSVATGRAIAAAAAQRFLPLGLELGGKNPMIVCADADLPAAMRAAVKGMNYTTQGQSCGSYSRLFLHDSIHDEALEILADLIDQIRLGQPLDEEADMGAMVTQRARDQAEAFIAGARRDGALMLRGGNRPADEALRRGWYLQPTLMVGVTQDMRIAREEIFGPVQSILCWSETSAVIAAANATEYGLTANICTRDLDRAFHLARQIESGSVVINGDGSQHRFGAPFGGFKSSGQGKEESLEEILWTTREKNLYVNLRAP